MVQMQNYIRLTDILMTFWERIKGDKYLPNESDIDPEYLKEVWEDCFLVKIRGNTYKYDYLGNNLVAAFGENVVRDEVEFLVSPSANRAMDKFQSLIKTHQPIYDESEFLNSSGVMIKYRQILLPFTRSGKEVEYILGGMRWRGF